ncbi:MAG: hypothetical protein ABJC24_07760 [Chloroflexota bacterium]
MSSHLPAAARPRHTRKTLLTALLVAGAAACSSPTPSPTLLSSGPAFASSSSVGSPTPQPTPLTPVTPLPTPDYTNPPDPELMALIPTRLNGATIEVPPPSEFAYTPGDFAPAYGELGLRFRALQVAYVVDPRLSLYAARVDPPFPTTRELEPYLATAGQYVGIAGLHREPWRYRSIAGRVTWVRPEDNATVAGTMIYTWAADEYVFLLIGVDDRLNRALFEALPGENAPAATPRPSASAKASAESSATP